MATPVRDLLAQQSSNSVHDTDYYTASNKGWTKNYEPIRNLTVHTQVIREWRDEGARHTKEPRRTVVADFNHAFLPEYDNNEIRLSEPAYPPNYRR